MNITKHALFRYATRVNKDTIVSDRTFPMFEKDNPELIEQYRKEIIELFDKSTFIGEFTFDNKKAHFSLNQDEMVVIVSSHKDPTVITLYDVDYDLDAIGNKQMLKILLGNYDRVQEQIETFDSVEEDRTNRIDEKISLVNIEINNCEAELRRLNAEKSKLNDSITISKMERTKMFNNLGAICERIVRPKLCK